MTYQLLLFL